MEVLRSLEEEVLIGAALAHHDARNLFQQLHVVGVTLELLAVDFHQLVAAGIGREGRLDARNVATDGGCLHAVLGVLAQFLLQQVAGNVVVIDHQRRLGIAGTHIVDGGLHELDQVAGLQVALEADRLRIEVIVLLQSVGTLDFLHCHSLHGGVLRGLAVVGNTHVVHVQQLSQQGVALLSGLGLGNLGLQYVGTVDIEVLTLLGAVLEDHRPILVGIEQIAVVLRVRGLVLVHVLLIERYGLHHHLRQRVVLASFHGGLGHHRHHSGAKEHCNHQFLDRFHRLLLLFLFVS